jgi:hypothetical protein
MSRFTIDQRISLSGPKTEKLPESARKPVRKINHAACKSPGYGETKTSPMRESGSHVSPRVNPNNVLALGRMFPRKRARVLKALSAQGLLDIVAVIAIVQPKV